MAHQQDWIKYRDVHFIEQTLNWPQVKIDCQEQKLRAGKEDIKLNQFNQKWTHTIEAIATVKLTYLTSKYTS